jgi:hypothetical protein
VASGAAVMVTVVFLTVATIYSLLSVFLKTAMHFNKLFALIISLVSYIILNMHYSKTGLIQELQERYKDEPLSRRRLRGWLFSLYMIFVLLTPVVISYLRHNLKMDI